MPTPQPNQPNRDDNFDDLFQQLIGGSLPAVLPSDQLLAAHEPISKKFGAVDVRDPEDSQERAAIDHFTDTFRQRIKKNHAAEYSQVAGILIHESKVDVFKNGQQAYTLIAEVRGRDGSSLIPNHTRLCPAENGPVFLWVRQSDQGGIQVVALYSKAAFDAEIKSLRDDGKAILADRTRHPLMLTYLFKTMSQKTGEYGKTDVQITSFQPLADPTSFRMNSNYGTIDCKIVRNDPTCNISYHFAFPKGIKDK